MKSSNSEISLYVDTLIVEALLTDIHLSKTAQASMGHDLIAKVKDYFGAHVDSENKASSVLNLLAPGVISVTLGAMGLPWIGALLAFSARFFDIDIAGMLSSIWTKVKSAISGDQKVSSTQIDTIVNDAVSKENTPATEADLDAAVKNNEKKSSVRLREAKLLKIALIEFDKNPKITKEAAGLLSIFNSKKGGTVSMLATVLKWIFKIALASAGFMVAGDVANKLLGRPNALDGSVQNGHPVAQSAPAPKLISKQTKFPVNPSYSDQNQQGPDGWIENVPNNKGSIANMLLNWTKQVYKGLDGLDAVIQNTAGFQTLVETIAWQNHSSTGGPIVFIPKMFTSKKMVVDHFMDEVAEKAPK